MTDEPTTYYVRNDSTGEIVKKSAVVPTLPNDRLGGTLYAFATEDEYNAYIEAQEPTDEERRYDDEGWKQIW